MACRGAQEPSDTITHDFELIVNGSRCGKRAVVPQEQPGSGWVQDEGAVSKMAGVTNHDASDSCGDLQALEALKNDFGKVQQQIGRVVFGQEEVVQELLVTILGGGHGLLVGVPGLAKTLLIRTLAQAMAMAFKRIQFTPDLMPADVTGTDVIFENRSSGEREFRFMPGPVFANIVLADEVNRTPPKTQAALLEAMQERQVTIGGTRHDLPRPFFVLATQNPLDQEGTYPLPEAQLDRFMFQILIGYPSQDEELEIALSTTAADPAEIDAVIDAETMLKYQALVRRLPISQAVGDYAVRLARATRPDLSAADEHVRKYVRWGAGPRASQYLVLGAKAKAALMGQPQVRPDDVAAVALSVLRHRVRLNFAAEADGVQLEAFLQDLIRQTSVEGKGATRGADQLFRSENAG